MMMTRRWQNVETTGSAALNVDRGTYGVRVKKGATANFTPE
jgi:hypothetical protein